MDGMKKMQTDIADIAFVGDEEKDMICAKNAGAYAVLINRDNVIKKYGQDKVIHNISELLDLFYSNRNLLCRLL